MMDITRILLISLLSLFSFALFSQEGSEYIDFSDYFSFHGEGQTGKVYFAIDNNRHNKKGTVKASNFLYFNIDGEWVKLKGHKNYKGKSGDLRKCVNSEDFTFVYEGDELSSIVSITNDLRIDFEKELRHTADYGVEEILFDMYATSAILTYKGRSFKGNIISERLRVKEDLKTLGNITNVVFKGFKYDGFYLHAPDFGDVYIHLISPEETINICTDNVYNLNTKSGAKDLNLSTADYRVTKSKRVGFKKLPLEIEVDLGESKLSLTTSHFKKYRNLLFFAFGMGVVEGDLLYEGKTYPVYGLSELFEF